VIKVAKAKARNYKRIVFSGEQSIGKTTAAFNWAKKPLWIDLDNRIPPEIVERCTVIQGLHDYNSVKSVLKEINESDSFEYDAIIIDTVTILESMARNQCIIDDFKGERSAYSGYSTGDKQHLILFMNPLLAFLDRIAEKHGCDLLLICHSEIKPVKNPNGENYDKVALSLVDKIRNRVLQWADYVGFAWHDVSVKVEGLSKKASGSSRKITFSNNPKWDAKGPANLPEIIDFDVDGNWMETIKNAHKKPVQETTTTEDVAEKVETKKTVRLTK